MQGCVVLCFMARSSFKRRPLAATYLCRKAAKARFDNRTNSRGEVSKGEGSRPLPFGRFKGKGSLRKGGNRNPPFLKWRSLVTFFRQGKKVTRRRQKKENSPRRGAEQLLFRQGKKVTRRRQKEESSPHRGAKHPVYFSTSPNVSLNENLSSPLRKPFRLSRFTEPFTVKSNKTRINAKSQFVHRMLKMTNPTSHFYKFF